MPTELPSEGQSTNDGQKRFTPTRQTTLAGDGPGHVEALQISAQARQSLIDNLAEFQVRRKFYIGLINQQMNAAKALVRRALGWKWDEEKASREGINKRAAAIVAKAMKGEELAEADAAIAASLWVDLDIIRRAMLPLEGQRHQVELDMKRHARKLPVAEWAKGVRGLGELGLAVIIAECGDLSNYPNPAKVQKRLGLAPFKGKACSTWRREGGLTADEWSAVGYSPRRRAEIFAVIGDPLFRQQTMIVGPYRIVYDGRRARTAETHPDWSKLHSHRDALRIMTKQLVLDLWVEWRRARRQLNPTPVVPAA